MSTSTSRDPTPTRALRALFIWLSHRRALGRLSTRIPITRPMVRRFIAGESLPEVLPALERLRDGGYLTTVDVLGESVDSADTCGLAAGRYEETLEALAARGLERNVSLKLTQMGLDIDRDLCRDTVARVFRKAAEVGAFVRIDMEDHTRADKTLELWRELRPLNPESGVVIQAALHRSARDVEMLIAEGVRVRLCKGAYNEPTSVALREREAINRAYEAQARRLMADGSYPALATHDGRLIGRLIHWAEAEGIARDRYEFQMLHGVRRDLQAQLLERGFRVRVYVPYGTQWYPYFMRRLAEKPANVTFMLRSLMKEGTGGQSRD
ncbi:MAG: proline dehydrogenase family protein [Chloroflexota bacterium]